MKRTAGHDNGLVDSRATSVSIVTTLYRSKAFIEEFHARAMAAAEAISDDVELIFVDDGSPDDGIEVALELHDRDPRVVVVDLSRNFGHHRAMMTGLQQARGDLVFLIDVDLEADPEDLLRFHKLMLEQRCDVVYGVQAARQGTLFERLSGNAYYWLVARLGGVGVPRNLTTTRLMTRRYVRDLVRHRERELVISGLWVSTGYHQLAAPVQRHVRRQKTNYDLFYKLRLAVDYISSYSTNLLYHVLYTGLAISLLSLALLVFFLLRFLIEGSGVQGWTSLIVSIWMFGGLNLLTTGLIGLYVARIFQETKRRPYSIVRALHRREPEVTSVADAPASH